MSTSTSGASNATDFQPETGNPQSNVGGGLQPNSSNLQPVPNSKTSNVFNQPGINPQAFPKTESLSVLNTGKQTIPASKSSENSSSNSQFLTIFIFALVVVVLIIAIIIKIAQPADKINTKKVEAPPAVTKNPKPKTKKKSKTNKKKSKKRK